MFDTFEEKFEALQIRSPEAEQHFVYCVISTKIVCRPTCSSRLALRKNIRFYDTVAAAINDGFTPCKRCKPQITQDWNTQRALVIKMIDYITNLALQGKTDKALKLDHLSKKFKISKWHMLRLFKRYTDKTPLQYFNDFKKHRLNVEVPLIETKKSYLTKQLSQYMPDFGDNEDDEKLIGEWDIGSNGELEFIVPQTS